MIYDLGNRQWDIPQLRILLENILPEKSIITNFEITYRFSHIGVRTISINARELIEEDASQRLILISFDDITKEKSKAELLEQAVQRRTAELEALNKELLAFAYISSHDLQEPLRKILIFTGRILNEEQKNLTPKAKDYFDRIQDAAQRMQKLIEDLLAFSRLNSTEKIFENIDLKTIANEVKDELKDIINEKNATIEIADLSTVGVIPFQFRQLLQNLISNALKFSRKDVAPYIVISSLVVEGKSVSGVTLVPDNKYYHICIKDNGIGFKPEYKDKIFEVFQKLHTLKDYSGKGIGLAIVKKIVENHQGIITATGVVDKGAIFDIYLPIL